MRTDSKGRSMISQLHLSESRKKQDSDILNLSKVISVLKCFGKGYIIDDIALKGLALDNNETDIIVLIHILRMQTNFNIYLDF
jgi:hypothetical protein